MQLFLFCAESRVRFACFPALKISLQPYFSVLFRTGTQSNIKQNNDKSVTEDLGRAFSFSAVKQIITWLANICYGSRYYGTHSF